MYILYIEYREVLEKLYNLFNVNTHNYRVLSDKIKESMDSELPHLKQMYEESLEARKGLQVKQEKDVENSNT